MVEPDEIARITASLTYKNGNFICFTLIFSRLHGQELQVGWMQGIEEKKERRTAFRRLDQATQWMVSPFTPTAKTEGERDRAALFSLMFPLFPILFSFSPSSLAFQGTQLSQDYMFTFKHAFFPPGSLSDILMAAAGFAFPGYRIQREPFFLSVV